jgi:putative hydrolase of the HAD superfamily
VASFAATARAAAERRGDVEPGALAAAARARARALWRAGPAWDWCRRIGMSSWEGLWCRFEGDGDGPRALRAWAPGYRREAWRRALAEQGVDDGELAEELAARFGEERRTRHAVFADAGPFLRAARDAGDAVALVTNGASCLQREKLAAAGLEGLLDAVVVSGDRGAGKPEPAIYAEALERLGAAPAGATMIGDSLERDVRGALAAGLGAAVWLNRAGRPRPAGREDLAEVATLAALTGGSGPA